MGRASYSVPKLKKEIQIFQENVPMENIISMEKNFIKFNNIIGLPKHPSTFQEMEIMPYQKELQKIIHDSVNNFFHVNKARQMGMTEIILRIILYEVFFKYAGGKIAIIAGTRLGTTKDIFLRLKEMCRNIPEHIIEFGAEHIIFANGTVIQAFAANPEALTGLTKIKCIFMDEAAKWDLKDDSPVMNGIMPIARTNKSDLIMISTPKGPRGFFYEIDTSENSFMKIKYDIYTVQGFLYSTEEIEQMLNSSIEDPAQEYLNQYVSSRESFLGPVDSENEIEEEEWQL